MDKLGNQLIEAHNMDTTILQIIFSRRLGVATKQIY